jgi:hypothetical protein
VAACGATIVEGRQLRVESAFTLPQDIMKGSNTFVKPLKLQSVKHSHCVIQHLEEHP